MKIQIMCIYNTHYTVQVYIDCGTIISNEERQLDIRVKAILNHSDSQYSIKVFVLQN